MRGEALFSFVLLVIWAVIAVFVPTVFWTWLLS